MIYNYVANCDALPFSDKFAGKGKGRLRDKMNFDLVRHLQHVSEGRLNTAPQPPPVRKHPSPKTARSKLVQSIQAAIPT